MTTDSWTIRPAPAASAAATTAAEPWMRTRWLAAHAWALMNCRIGGIAVARLTTTSCPANASASALGSNSDTSTGVAPCWRSQSALTGLRASADTWWPADTKAGTAWPPRAPVPPVTNTGTPGMLARLCLRAAGPEEFEQLGGVGGEHVQRSDLPVPHFDHVDDRQVEMAPVGGGRLLPPQDHHAVAGRHDERLHPAVAGALQAVPGGGVGEGVPDRAVVTVVDAAVRQRCRLGDHDVVGVGAQQCLGVAPLGRLEHAPDRAQAGARRGLLPGVVVGELAQFGDLAIAEREHVGKRASLRLAGSRWLAG